MSLHEVSANAYQGTSDGSGCSIQIAMGPIVPAFCECQNPVPDPANVAGSRPAGSHLQCQCRRVISHTYSSRLMAWNSSNSLKYIGDYTV